MKINKNLTITRSLAGVALVAAVAVLAGGCTSGTGTPSGGSTTPAATGAATTGAASPTVATTTATPPLILTTPQAAAEHLYNAWQAADKPTALLAASTAAVDTLFAKKWKASTYFFGGCTVPTAPSECDYNWSGGIIAMHIDGSATTGFRVSSVSTGSAG